MADFILENEELNEKEKKILEAAISIFSEKGYSGSSTSEIAKRAKVAEGTIFRYYKTKKDILRSIMIQMINLVSKRIVFSSIEKIFEDSEEMELKDILRELIIDRIKLVEKVFPMARVVLAESLFHEDIREAIYNNIITRFIEMYSHIHKEMQEKNYIREDLNEIVALRSIVANIFIFIAQRKLFGDKFLIDENTLEKDIDEVIDVILRGISK
jgi:AcrR family transcriptional regulator